MINRPGRSPRSRSVTSPARASLLTCGFTLATVTVATLNTPVASAEPVVRCRTREGGGDYTCITETPTPTTGTTGSGSSGSGGLGAWFSEHAGVILFVIAVAAVIAIAAAVKSGTSKDKAAASEADLARGRAIAQSAHAAAVQRAHAEAAAQMPPREVWDPHGVGLAPPPMPAPKVPPAPPTSPTDLARYAAFGDVVPWIEGSALAAVTAPNGDRSRAEAAFAEAVRTAGLGTTDENGTFIPDATLASVRAYLDGSGDVEFVAQPRDLTIGEKQLAKITHFLLLTARVASAGNWEREVETGRYMIRLSMNAKATQQQEQVQEPKETGPRIDPRWA
ncbi:hypothetical protein [Mycobacteroides abscessus]|uniref:hypothetical protein n=1 Tax=Mycobacteroides abscessus TaxID=36809 RepID=UPI001F284690|nr:hypothetical protein [Mycobacteroides abscessus]